MQSVVRHCRCVAVSLRPSCSRLQRLLASAATRAAPFTTSAQDVRGSALPVVDSITSVTNSYVKHCVRLRESSKYRQQQQRVLLVGDTLIQELADARGGLEARVLFVKAGATPPQHVSWRKLVSVSEHVLRKLAGLENCEGLGRVAEVDMPQWRLPRASSNNADGAASTSSTMQESSSMHTPDLELLHQQQLPQLRRVLVLEGIQDPGNCGTLLRCALAFGWDAAWLLPGCCDPFNDKALRAARGAPLRLPVLFGCWDELEQLVQEHGLVLLAAEPDKTTPVQALHDSPVAAARTGSSSSGVAECSASASADNPVALVLGTEGQGLSQFALQQCQSVSIPMVGAMESLNVGIAGGILMFALSDSAGSLSLRLEELGVRPQQCD